MKCPKCIGIGRTLYPPKDGGKAYIGDCDRCHGTGEIEVTNEEYIRQASVEELAEFIATQCADAIRLWREKQFWTAHEKCKSDKWYVWLKEKHNA